LDAIFKAFPFAFPVFFVGMWLLVTTVLGFMSGWSSLARRFPDRSEAALLKIGSQSGVMGPMGVGMRGILVLSACPSGLRVAIWRIFGPFSRPFLVPWDEIGVRPVKIFFRSYARLSFGRAEAGVLSIERNVWDRLARCASQAAGSQVAEPLPPLPRGALRRGYLLEWLAISVLAAAFFVLAPRLMDPSGPHIPLAICIGFPTVSFGLMQAVRYVVRRLQP
jgi:hypothetical protein